MLVLSNRNIVIPCPDGSTSIRLVRGSISPVPDWVPQTAYFRALVSDGKIVPSVPRSDKELEKKTSERRKQKPDPPETHEQLE